MHTEVINMEQSGPSHHKNNKYNLINIMITYTILILALISCMVYIYYSYIQNKKQFDKVYSELADNLIVLNKLDKFTKRKTREIDEDIYQLIEDVERNKKEQSEFNKLYQQQLGKIDVALINLIDVPFIENELAPGYQKEWNGEVPYKITDIFVGAELKMSNEYVYSIDKIDGKSISISRKK